MLPANDTAGPACPPAYTSVRIRVSNPALAEGTLFMGQNLIFLAGASSQQITLWAVVRPGYRVPPKSCFVEKLSEIPSFFIYHI